MVVVGSAAVKTPVDICYMLTCVYSWGDVGEALKFQSSLLNLKSCRDFELKVLKSNRIHLFPDLRAFWTCIGENRIVFQLVRFAW